jgi:hypothetical protein
MKNKLLIIFILFAFSGFSQSNIWTKGNAVWQYSFYSNHEMGRIKVWEDGDTVLLGHPCTKIKGVKYSLALAGPQAGQFEFMTDYPGGAIYTSNDTVFYWDEDHFSVLYDFSAQVSDEWYLQTGGNPAHACNDTSVAIVESVGTIVIDGQTYSELTIGNSPYSAFYLSGKANSRFGSSEGYLLPLGRVCDSTVSGWEEQITFRCFEDDSLFYNPSGEPCRYYLGLTESALNSVSIFPNPSQGKIELLSEVPLKKIRVMSILGAVLKEVDTNLTMAQIDLSEFPQGTYCLTIQNTSGENIVKRIQIVR